VQPGEILSHIAERLRPAGSVTREQVMQVNWHYHRALLRDPWTALDPYLRVGAWVLAGHWHERCDLWETIGRYHAPAAPERAAAYRERVRRWFAGSSPAIGR
jgi:hypothetical protein